MLICDGHDSHISGNFISYCMDHSIHILVLSHLLQPLDLSIFGPLKTYLSQETDRFSRAGATRLQRYEWGLAFYRAHQQAFQSKNVLSGFFQMAVFFLLHLIWCIANSFQLPFQS